jgi:hypothetical protein
MDKQTVEIAGTTRIATGMLVFLFLLTNGGARTVFANEIPGGIPYQGVLELGGTPVTGTKTLRFQVTEAAGDPVLWQGERTVELRQGRFSTFLAGAWNGKELSHLIAGGRDLYLRIAIYENDSFVEFSGMQRLAPTAYAITPAFGAVPIGTVIDWFGNSASLPYGYAVADGSVVTDPDSPLNGITLPNLINKFVRGRPAEAVTEMFTTGGGDSHTHTADTRHTHTANHRHANVSSAGAGLHYHTVMRFDTDHNCWFDGQGDRLDENQWNGLDRAGEGYYGLLRGGGSESTYAHSSTNGSHSHTVGTPWVSVTTSESGSAAMPTTNSHNVPAYVGLLKLIRIK